MAVLPLLYKLEVVLIEDNLLNVMVRHLTHEQALGVALFVSLDDLIFETQELQDLIEHVWLHTASRGQ